MSWKAVKAQSLNPGTLNRSAFRFHLSILRNLGELLETNSNLSTILESISDGFFSLNRRLEVTCFNRTALKLLDRKASEPPRTR